MYDYLVLVIVYLVIHDSLATTLQVKHQRGVLNNRNQQQFDKFDAVNKKICINLQHELLNICHDLAHLNNLKSIHVIW